MSKPKNKKCEWWNPREFENKRKNVLMKISTAYWLPRVGWQVDSRCLFTSPIRYQGPRAARHGVKEEPNKSGVQVISAVLSLISKASMGRHSK